MNEPKARKVAFDRDVLLLFLRAVAGEESTGREALAALRIVLYAATPYIVPTISREIEEDGTPVERDWRSQQQLAEIVDATDTYHGCVTTMTYRYMDYHSDPRECRVVVEAECAQLDAFLTLNNELTKALAPRAEQIAIMRPSDYWASVNVPRGTEPRWTPGPGHPLLGLDWWRW
jgi:hypothetical protein